MKSIRRWSLRARLSAIVLVITGAGLFITDIVSLTSLNTYLVQQVDNQLRTAVAGPVLRLDEFSAGGDMMRRGRIPSTLSVTVLDATGNVLGQYGGGLRTDEGLPDLAGTTLNEVVKKAGRPFTVGSPSGNQFRAIARTVVGGTSTVVVTQSLAPVQETLGHVTLLLFAISLVVLALIAFLAGGVVRLGMRPLRRVEETAEAIAAGDLSARLPEADPATEVGRLTQSLNTMLTRIEEAFRVRTESEEQLRRFVADASHELRTPLTAIRGFSELARKGMVPADEATDRIERESVRMTTLVEDLLLLARLDQQRPLMKEPVNIGLLLDEVVESSRAAGPSYPVELDLPDEEIIIEGDNARLHQAVTNLLTNARTHNREGTRIAVRAIPDADQVKIIVRDDGHGIEPEHLNRIFERFYRADSSRARGENRDNGSGLGLSIVKAIVEASGGSIGVKSAIDEGTEVTISLPRS